MDIDVIVSPMDGLFGRFQCHFDITIFKRQECAQGDHFCGLWFNDGIALAHAHAKVHPSPSNFLERTTFFILSEKFTSKSRSRNGIVGFENTAAFK